VKTARPLGGPADYALCMGGRIVGIVEAKKLTLGPQNVPSQAERYSKGIHEPTLQSGDFGVPFLYSTNGEVIWYHDVRNQLSPTVDRPLQRIREFRNRPNPGIVVSVDMLTTGVDIPDLEFIVFLRPAKSRILFEQMLGRGTRKVEKYQLPDIGKGPVQPRIEKPVQPPRHEMAVVDHRRNRTWWIGAGDSL
jgi:type I site-specific restriction endonuclease